MQCKPSFAQLHYFLLYICVYLYILFGILSFSYFALFVSIDLKRKQFKISIYMYIVTIKAYSILFYSILFYSILFYSILFYSRCIKNCTKLNYLTFYFVHTAFYYNNALLLV